MRNDRQTLPARENRAMRIIFIAAAAILVITAPIHFNAIVVLLTLLSLAGVFVSGLAVRRSIDKNDPLSARFCDTEGLFDCDKVLKSLSFSKYIFPGDVGLIYFSGLYLFLLFCTVTNGNGIALTMMILPSFLSFAASLASLWYQGRVIKSWCKICLMVVAITWIQAIAVAYYCLSNMAYTQAHFDATLHREEWIRATALLLISLLLAATWLFIKPVIVKAEHAKVLRNRIRTWKRDPGLFIALQQQQPRIDMSLWPGDFILGNPEAPVKVMVAISLYCKGCVGEYKRLEKLLSFSPKNVAVIIRFKHIADKNPGNTLALQYILDKYANAGKSEEKQRILSVWFARRNLGECKRELGNTPPARDHGELIRQNERWFSENKILRTPTVFVNGHQLAESYMTTDLIPLMAKLPGRMQ